MLRLMLALRGLLKGEGWWNKGGLVMMGETEGGMMEGGMMRGVVLRGNKEGLGCLNDENDEDNEGEVEEGSMKDELVIELVLAGE